MVALNGPIRTEQVERTKFSRKILYHFAILAIVNGILMFKDSRIRAFARPTIAESGPSIAHKPFELRGSRRYAGRLLQSPRAVRSSAIIDWTNSAIFKH